MITVSNVNNDTDPKGTETMNTTTITLSNHQHLSTVLSGVPMEIAPTVTLAARDSAGRGRPLAAGPREYVLTFPASAETVAAAIPAMSHGKVHGTAVRAILDAQVGRSVRKGALTGDWKASKASKGALIALASKYSDVFTEWAAENAADIADVAKADAPAADEAPAADTTDATV